MSTINRREFARRVGAAGLGLGLAPGWVEAARPGSYDAEFGNMLLSLLAKRHSTWSDKWDQERARIRTAADLEARNRFVRDKMREMLRGYPHRTALAPVIVKTQERTGYRLENVMFQSRPNFWVTGNLYIPTTGSGPFPGIISPCGHYPVARMEPEYQFAYINLVKNGFAVLAYDPVGQGERRQYWNPETGAEEVGGPIYEHSMPGQLLILMGENLTQYRVWDGMRAIDYLLTRPEVDKKKIGCAGHSGGGTLTKFIAAVDERVQCAVINEGGTMHRFPPRFSPGGRVGPSDVEQNLFPAAIYGVDACDLHVAVAPRPLLALIEDFSPGFDETAGHVKERYRLMGIPERFETEEAADPHAWTVKLRLATTNWFCRWFYDRKGPDREPDFEPEPERVLYCMPNGSIRYSRQGETVFSLILKKRAQLPPERKAPASPEEIEKLIRYRKCQDPLGVRRLVTTPRKGYQVEKLEFLSEPGIYIPTWVFLPEKRGEAQQALLFVNEAGKQADGMEFGALEALARKGQLIVAVDVRGMGETRPSSASSISGGEFQHLFSTETAMAYLAWYIDESLFGMRVQDVIRSVDYTLSRADVDRIGVRVIGRGAGALWAMYAAALDPRISSVILDGGLLSYRALTGVDRYLHDASVFIPDVLLNFDLPHVAAAIASRNLVLLSPVDAMKKPVPLPEAQKAYAFTEQAYQRAGAANRFRVAGRRADPAEQYLELL